MGNFSQTLSKNKLLFLGILLITLLFISYNIFLTSNNPGEVKGAEDSLLEKIKTSLDRPARQGEIDDMAAQDSRLEEIEGASTERTFLWAATDYQSGEIKSGKYVVKEGDTLWEIAEAVYGDGNEWRKILTANVETVGFLPNGSQALITTGQTLILP